MPVKVDRGALWHCKEREKGGEGEELPKRIADDKEGNVYRLGVVENIILTFDHISIG